VDHGGMGLPAPIKAHIDTVLMAIARKSARKSAPATRHIVSINDLSDADIERVFEVAQSYLEKFPDPNFPYRIRRSTNLASDFILASLFYEPSTRTRLSFESAMLRLGGDVITSADPLTSSAAKGESLADAVRVVGNYADVIVIRHPRDGAARLAAEYSPIPIINGGDGSHEHPTQTLCDIFTIKKKKKNLKKLNVAIAGDLKGSRTIHSFVYALARLGAHIVPMPAPGMELPAHVDRRLREEFGCTFRRHGSIGALYMTPEEPHQPALFSEPDFGFEFKRSGEKIAAVYVTRFQKERWAEKEQAYPKIDAKFLRESKYAHASVLHPLPRVGELDVALDSDVRAVYFEQAAYGVPIRMALISLLLGVGDASFETFQGGFRPQRWPLYDQPLDVGVRCANPNCIVHEAMEGPYVRNKFHIVPIGEDFGLRCMYCENDIDRVVIASKKGKWFSADTRSLSKVSAQKLKDTVFFESERDAQANGFHSKRATAA
jgi:aspartate carbamoyltransferase catalytic subunit